MNGNQLVNQNTRSITKKIAAQFPGIAATAFAAIITITGLFVTGRVEWGNRLAEARLEEYQQITLSVEEANSLIDRFTRALYSNGTVDAAVLDQLSTNLGTQFSRVDRFKDNLSAEGQRIAEEYRETLNRLKFGLVTIQTVEDLEFVGTTMAEMYGTQDRLMPYLAAAAGTAQEPAAEV